MLVFNEVTNAIGGVLEIVNYIMRDVHGTCESKGLSERGSLCNFTISFDVLSRET